MWIANSAARLSLLILFRAILTQPHALTGPATPAGVVTTAGILVSGLGTFTTVRSPRQRPQFVGEYFAGQAGGTALLF